jgi:hypothetical protein
MGPTSNPMDDNILGIRRSQRIATSSQTPLQIDTRDARTGATVQERLSPTGPKRPIKPQVRLHNVELIPSNAAVTTSYNNDNTPFIRKQLLLSEGDNIFQATRINRPESPKSRPIRLNQHRSKQAEQSQTTASRVRELIMMDTPSRIRNLVDRITPTVSKIFSRSQSNFDISESQVPSSPLLSMPTIKANKQRHATFADEAQNFYPEVEREYSSKEPSESPPASLLNLVSYLVLFFPRFCWNNLLVISRLGFYIFVFPFLKTFQFLTQNQASNIDEEQHKYVMSFYYSF